MKSGVFKRTALVAALAAIGSVVEPAKFIFMNFSKT